jgi:hypothetical protein
MTTDYQGSMERMKHYLFIKTMKQKFYLIIKAKPNITDYQSDVEKNTLSAIKTMKSNTTDYQGSETRMRHYLLSRQ